MKLLQVLGCWVGLALLSGCSTAGFVLQAAGAATDSSLAWAVLKHVHGRLTEGQPLPCGRLDAVERALTPRCGPPEGPLSPADLAASRLPECPLQLAARDPRLWPALDPLIAAGAAPEACNESPLVALAQAQADQAGCVDFQSASEAGLRSLRWLAAVDARAVHHDVVRMFSCPQARAAGLDRVLDDWLAQDELAPGALAFSPLGALHPSQLPSPRAQALIDRGHTPQTALDGYAGRAPPGFEVALREARWPALIWWLDQAPSLVNRVPPMRGGDLPWVPLERVLRPGFLADAAQAGEVIALLLAHGADPSQRLPHQPDRTVLGQAVLMGHPLRALLDAPATAPMAPPSPASTLAAVTAPATALAAATPPPYPSPSR